MTMHVSFQAHMSQSHIIVLDIALSDHECIPKITGHGLVHLKQKIGFPISRLFY